jgi:hypothetical protein
MTIARASWITTKSDRYSSTVFLQLRYSQVLRPAQSWWGNQLCFFQRTCLQPGEDRLGKGSFRRFQLPSSSTLPNALPITIAYSRALAQNITNPLP